MPPHLTIVHLLCGQRLGYDSLDTSTDMLPTLEEVQERGFFPVMSHYFEVNGRWSIDKRVPSLGNASTPLSEVHYVCARVSAPTCARLRWCALL